MIVLCPITFIYNMNKNSKLETWYFLNVSSSPHHVNAYKKYKIDDIERLL
jgi:hypothetical protein